jgi:hypothetical protein
MKVLLQASIHGLVPVPPEKLILISKKCGIKMIRVFILGMAILGILGCKKAAIQVEVFEQIFSPFRVPEEKVPKEQFYATLKERCSLPSDAVVISYTYNFEPFVVDKDDFYTSAGVTIRFIAASNSRAVSFDVKEE